MGLMYIPTEGEIKDCLWSLHPLKSPSLDGFYGNFYRNYWSTVKEKLINSKMECLWLGCISFAANKTFLVLIPKIEKANNFNHYRLINLCNIAYRVVAKILATRLSKLLNNIVSPNQKAFMRGRWIAENTIVS